MSLKLKIRKSILILAIVIMSVPQSQILALETETDIPLPGGFGEQTNEDLNLIYGGNYYAPLGEGFGSCDFGYTGVIGEGASAVWSYLRAQNFSEEQTAGIMGNLMWESANMWQDAVNASSGATGIAQWLGVRLTRLEEYAAARGSDVMNLQIQLDFLMFELTGESPTPEIAELVSGVEGGGYENLAYRDMLTRNTIDEAAGSWAMLFERYTEAINYRQDTAAVVGNNPDQQIPPPPGFEDDFIFAFNTAPTGGEGTGGGTRIDFARQLYQEFTGTFATSALCGESGEVIVGDTSHIPCEAGTLVDDMAEGYAGGELYTIRTCNVQGIVVNSQISGEIDALINAARSVVGEFGGWGYRTMARQIELRRQESRLCGDDELPITEDEVFNAPSSSCSPPTARPGYSNHQMGLAIDFHVNGAVIRSGSALFNWLVDNAESYGMFNLPSETWHWSIDGG